MVSSSLHDVRNGTESIIHSSSSSLSFSDSHLSQQEQHRLEASPSFLPSCSSVGAAVSASVSVVPSCTNRRTTPPPPSPPPPSSSRWRYSSSSSSSRSSSSSSSFDPFPFVSLVRRAFLSLLFSSVLLSSPLSPFFSSSSSSSFFFVSCASSPRQGSLSPSQLSSSQYQSTLSSSYSPKSYDAASPCPRGSYRSLGLHDTECTLCPRGRYGVSEGLVSAACTALCPTGRYNSVQGATSLDECDFCPPGKFGKTEGLKTSDCSGDCRTGRYASAYGLTTEDDCQTCQPGYRSWSCVWSQSPRKGTFESTTGAINEYAHYYLDANKNTKLGQLLGKTDFPDGEWAADKYAGEYAGEWDRGKGAGAYPPNSPYMSGRTDKNFEPSPQVYVPVP